MAKVTGPLMSLEASGTVAKTITFSRWKGRPYVRQTVRPANPRSPGQQRTRAMLKYLSQAWQAVAALAKTSWSLAAEANKVSNFNAFVRANMMDWSSDLPPADTAGTDRTASTTDSPAFVAVGGVRQAVLSITDGASMVAATGFVISRLKAGEAAAVTVAVIPRTGGTTTFTDSPVAPGTYTYTVTAWADGELFGNPVTIAPIVVT